MYMHSMSGQPRWLSGLMRSRIHSLWLLVDHCVLRNWDRILVRAVKGLISRAGMVSICPLLWQRDVKLQQTAFNVWYWSILRIHVVDKYSLIIICYMWYVQLLMDVVIDVNDIFHKCSRQHMIKSLRKNIGIVVSLWFVWLLFFNLGKYCIFLLILLMVCCIFCQIYHNVIWNIKIVLLLSC